HRLLCHVGEDGSELPAQLGLKRTIQHASRRTVKVGGPWWIHASVPFPVVLAVREIRLVLAPRLMCLPALLLLARFGLCRGGRGQVRGAVFLRHSSPLRLHPSVYPRPLLPPRLPADSVANPPTTAVNRESSINGTPGLAQRYLPVSAPGEGKIAREK